MALEGEVEATELVSRQGVGTELQDNCARTEGLDDLLDDLRWCQLCQDRRDSQA